MTTRRRRGPSERGFALLLVFLLAATVALMLYQQLPRVAFESERDKEQLLIDRGEQYKRAIQLFYVANKRWPTTLEELERFQDKRYLRRRYKDPMTGKDEWRLIHHNGMFLTDSLVTKPPSEEEQKKQLAANTQGAAGAAAAAGAPDGAGVAGTTPGMPGAVPEVNAAVLRRPSDRPLVGQEPAFPPGEPFDPNSAAGNPAPFNPNTPISLVSVPQQGGATGQPNFAPPAFNQTGFPPNNSSGFNSQLPPITLTPVTSQPGGVPQNQPFQPQFPGQQFPGQQFPGQQFPGQQPLPGQFPGAQFPNPAATPAPQPAQFRIDANGQFIPITPAPNSGVAPGITQPGIGQPGVAPQPSIPPQSQFLPGPNSPQFGPNNPIFQGAQNQVRQALPGGQPVPPGGANPAINLINQLLTTPRQPPAGINAPLPGGITPGATGIAGVASTSTSPSIKLYKERGKYSEWEFVFDLQQGLPGQAGVPGQQNPLANQPGQPNRSGAPGQPPAMGAPTAPLFPGGPAGR